MKKSAIKMSLMLTLLITCSGLIATGCGNSGSGGSAVSDSVVVDTTKVEGPPVPNHNVKPLDLGIIESFAAMAYSSISSSATSNVKGKIGLKPGTRANISLNSSEVDGGNDSIYSGDDVGDKATYLTLAREDLISAYRDAAALPTDKDKIEQFAGKLGGKVLPPGIYRWSEGVVIDSDVTLDGGSKDVWIFQITGNVSILNSARIQLGGNAKARNVFWQISGKVDMDSNTESVGTMMSQLVFEMKSGAKVYGRTLVKNAKLILNQNLIDLP